MRKTMLLFCLATMIAPSILYAHPPKKVVLSYDKNTRSLTVEVIHPVADPKVHFVNRVEIFVNDQVMIDKEPVRQNATSLSETFPLADVRAGDKIKAVAFCNWGGDQSGELQIDLAGKTQSVKP